MSNVPAKGNQLITLPVSPFELEQISFNTEKMNQLITSHGVTFQHYRAIPSPIGLKDRGDYRRSETLDTISENGFIYKKCGIFNGVMLSNNKSKPDIEGGTFDASHARVTLPMYYREDSPEHANERIHLAPGDRLFFAEVAQEEQDVVNYQKVNYNSFGDDFLQFPATCVEFIIDSLGREYKYGFDFTTSKDGNIRWIDGAKNPGIDPDTGKGRVYGIRYRYAAYYYITSIVNEVRIGKTTEGGIRKDTRFPYQITIQREYCFHNRVNGDSVSSSKETKTERTVAKPEENIDPVRNVIKVNVSSFE